MLRSCPWTNKVFLSPSPPLCSLCIMQRRPTQCSVLFQNTLNTQKAKSGGSQQMSSMLSLKYISAAVRLFVIACSGGGQKQGDAPELVALVGGQLVQVAQVLRHLAQHCVEGERHQHAQDDGACQADPQGCLQCVPASAAALVWQREPACHGSGHAGWAVPERGPQQNEGPCQHQH